MGDMEVMRNYILIPRAEWEKSVAILARVDALMELILEGGSVPLTTVCKMLDRPTVAKQVQEKEEAERKEYADWLKEKGVEK